MYLKEARKATGLTQEQAAKKSGIALGTLRRWEQGVNEPDMESIILLASLYKVSTDTILGSSFAQNLGELKTSTPASMVEVPLYGSVAAGEPIEMIEDVVMKEAPARFLEDDPDCFLVKMKGNSENRRGIFDGDYVLISPKYREPTPGDLFLMAVNGDEATLKEVAILENGIELIPDSYDPTYTRQIYNFNEPDTPPIATLGKYVWHCAAF